MAIADLAALAPVAERSIDAGATWRWLLEELGEDRAQHVLDVIMQREAVKAEVEAARLEKDTRASRGN